MLEAETQEHVCRCKHDEIIINANVEEQVAIAIILKQNMNKQFRQMSGDIIYTQ